MKKTRLGLLLFLVVLTVDLPAATFTVINTNSSGAGSLQQALFDANTNAGTDTISFNIAPGGLTIGLTNALPSIIEPVLIDGRTQPGFVSAPIIELNGASAGTAVDGLKVNTSNCVISALVINRFLGDQIEITNGANNVVEGCYLGLNLTGLTDASTGLNGILLTNSPNNTIGGLGATNRNYISGNNQSGVNFGGAATTNNFLLGNYIGLNVTNGPVVNSADGLRVNAPRNTIGGSATGARNIISGNTGQGIEITTAGLGTIVRGNYIGTDDTGAVDRGNSIDGILTSAGGVIIGGTNVGEGNLISGNAGDGIELTSVTATNNIILGNIIGASITTTAALPNDDNGVFITTNSRSNIIGGILTGEANTIAFNGADGINVAAVANTNNTFRGNSIFSNGTVSGELGIDLGVSGIQVNDSGDFDTGPNQLQNFPVLAWVTNTPGGTIFSGSLNSRPSITYAIDFYANTDVDTDGAGEGKYYLGTTNLTTAADSNVTFTVSLPVVALPGRYISATATDPFGNTSEFSTNVFAQSIVAGTTFTVVNTNNSGSGSLRQAIIDANANISAGDTIAFAITNLTTTINPASALPAIIDPVIIDGYTQPGAVVNTSASVFNAVLPVRLSGTSAGSVSGLNISAGNTTVRGLMITGFGADGITISSLGGNTISGNVIGLDAAGVDQGNAGNGVTINGSTNNLIGGPIPAARNVLSGNNSDGVEISGVLAQNNQVINNLIGTDQTGTLDRGNNGDGVYITLAGNNQIGTGVAGGGNLISGNGDNGIELSGLSTTNTVVLGNIIGATFAGDFDLPNSGDGVFITTSSRSNLIGGVLPGQANQISFNTGDGINVAAATANTNNTFRGNSIYSNGNLGIDLGANGVQINDSGDPDTGANQLQNFPILTTVTNSATNVVISGTLNSRPSITYTLDFYSSIWVDTTGVGEGQTWIGATNLATAADSNLAFTVSFAVTNLTGRYITATATDNFGNTSEFGTNVAAVSTAPGQIFTVVNTNDIGPGSLRDTIIAANLAITAGDTIVFAITNLSTTIRPASFLPAIIDSVTIDGTTQAGSVANTSSNGFNGVLPVVLDGVSAGSADGLRFTIGGNTVRGLNIINFGLDGLDFSGGGGNTVAGCVIGLDAASVDRGNSGNGILLTASANNVIGGPTFAARNVISGNTGDGIEISGVGSSNNIVAGNLIGTGLAGTLDLGNANGVLLTSAAHNRIGGTNSTERNVISGNSYGIFIQTAGATNNLIVGNYLGTDSTGTLDLGNGNEGIYVSGVPGNILGTVGAGNLISGNGGDGIELNGAGAATNIVRANRIGTDVTGSFAIANGNNGVLMSSAPGNTIGGATVAEGNLISGNGSDGVEISGATAAGNQVKNNLIGTTATGTAAIPNGNTGVFINSSAHDNDIGGSGNTIAFNNGDGVWVNTGTNNAFRHNLIFANGGLGIDLSTTGVTTNDGNDADTGANQLQNFPVLSAATNFLTQVNIAGALDSVANTSYDVDFFASVDIDSSGYGEGQFYLGSTNITTDGSGHADFLASFATTLTGRYVTATATDPNGNTSEFSPWVVAASTIAATNLIVTTTNDSGAGSLREAIQLANSFISSGADTISFAIAGAGVKTINLSNALPAITDTVLLDGYTQTGASANTLCAGNDAVLRIELAGGGIIGSADGLMLAGAGNITVRGLAIQAFWGDGVAITSGTNHQVAGCYIGMDVTGSSNTAGNVGYGIYVLGPGTSANRLGGETAADRNVISANSFTGITIENSPNNIVAGNFIGTDSSGTLDRGNGGSGVLVYLSGSVSNVIGGVTGCARNVISGNGEFTFADHYGIDLYSAVATRVLGNYIGLDVTGTQDLGNGSTGVRLRGASFNFIGDGTPAGRNIISGNSYGVELEFTSPTNVIVGNYIGTDVTGALDRGNLFYGVFLGSASYNLVLGNVISGNDNDAVNVPGNSSPGNRIIGNLIGVSASGGNALGNSGAGITIGQSSTQVGGTNVNEGNVIAFNSNDGVLITSGDVSCPVLGNSIYANGDLGIDLNSNGVTPNDAGDGDAGGNNLQNYPVLGEAIRYPTETIVTATLNSLPGSAYRIEFFNNSTNDPTGFGEGQTYLGFTNVTTDGSGNVAFAFAHPAALTVNNYLTATATDTNNNTSEFSGAQRIVSYDSVDLAVSIADSADPAPHATNFFYTIMLTNAGPTNATSVFVTNTLPATTAYVSSTTSQGSASHSSGIVVWNVGPVLDGGNASLVVQVSSIITGQVTNSAKVVSAESDHTPANNTDTEGTFLGLTDIAVTIQDSPDPVTAGQTVTFTVTVTNAGPDVATLSTLNFSVDADFHITGGSVSQGTVITGVGYYYAELGNIPVGGTATLTGTAIPMMTGALASHAEAYRAESDPNFANNILVNASTTVNAGPGVFEFTVPSTIVNETAGNATLTVQRLGGSIGSVTVDYAMSNLTAVAGSDFTATTGTLTFTNGETLKTILVPINNDIAAECNETFTAHLFNATGGAIVLRTTNIAVLIFDNEVSPSGTVDLLSATDTNLPPESGDDYSFKSSVSADGRYVVFSSDANNLVSTDQNFNRDVFVRDLLMQTTALVSRPTGSSSSGNGPSEGALISGNGRYVVFSSYASIFADEDDNFTQDVFVRDLVSLTTTLVSRNVTGSDSGDDTSYTSEPYRTLISSNGQSIVYGSYASDLTGVSDSNVDSDVFFYDRVAGTNRLISVNLAGTDTGNGSSADPVVSANGLVVAYASTADDLVALSDFNGGEDVFVQNLASGTNELISVNLSGTSAANGLSSAPYLSADGRYVVFQSSASNLAANDSNTRTDVFRRDRLTGVTALASVNTNGVAGNGYSSVHGISADGRYVLFASGSYDLVAGDYNSTEDVFVRDMVANVTVLVSRTPGGDPGNSTSRNPVISGDGTHVAFESYATDLTGATKFNYYTDIFVRNLTNNTMRLVSFRNGGTNGPNGDSFDAAISFKGGVTSFTGDAEGGGIGEGIMALSGSIEFSDVWAHTYASNTTELVSVAAPSTSGNGYSYDHQISASGAHIVFASYAENLAPGDTNENSDVFLFNLTNGVVSIVSMDSSNTGSGNGYSDVPDVSADGRYVAFYSTATNLVAGDNNDNGDIFRRDTVAGTTTLVSVNSSGSGPGNSASFDPDITPDGRFIAFETTATNLVASDLNGVFDDIVLRDMTSNVVELITVNATGTGTANAVSYDPVISDNGRFVAYESFATNLGPTDVNSRYDVYVRDRQLGTNLLCSRNLAGTDGGSEDSYDPVISGNGQIVVFYSYATNLVTGDTNGAGDIFAFNTTTHTRQLVSVALGGGAANDESSSPSISTDGRYVAFQSYATNLVANDSNGNISDVFLRDLLTGTTFLISGNCNSLGSGNDGSYAPSISGDGRYITFISAANDLVGGFYSASVQNVYRHDRLTSETVLVSQNRFITGGGNSDSYQPRVSSNGGAIAFVSSASNLIADDNNNNDDLFAWQGNLVASGVDLVLTKDASTNTVAQSGAFSYTLTATNYGSAGATGVTVTDALPPEVSFVSASTSQGTVTNSSGTIIATVGNLGVNAGVSITINVTAVTAGSISNFASVVAIESDGTPGNNSDSAIVTATAFAPPVLAIQPTNSTQLVVSWPAATPSSFVLETTTNLVPVIVWSPVTNAVSISGTNKFVILNLNAAEPERYYRLKQ